MKEYLIEMLKETSLCKICRGKKLKDNQGVEYCPICIMSGDDKYKITKNKRFKKYNKELFDYKTTTEWAIRENQANHFKILAMQISDGLKIKI